MVATSFFLFVTVLLCTSPSGPAGDCCCENATTQHELNECAKKALAEAESEMQRVTRQIRTHNAQLPEFLNEFEKAQKAWAAFRDAELKALFPLDTAEYGSVFPMCYLLWKAELTRQRIDQLKRWVDGVEEGDVCAGSQPVRPGK
jgi:uncharacterized protein YecT (DUF1311 family)